MGKLQNNKKCSDISIALCTCEGSIFLPAQLESLMDQSLLPGELVVCDDASTDDTLQLLEAFAEKAPFKVKIILNKKHMGVVQNFSRAMEICQGRYLALCDQDDIWLPDRLANAYQAMEEAENRCGISMPLLVHSDLKVTDCDGDAINPSFMKMRKIKHVERRPLKKLLAQNFVTGNTVLVNRPLLEAALPVADDAVMHDWWLALVAAALGKIVFIEKPTVMYRQHRHNVVGAKGFISFKSIKKVACFTELEKEIVGAIKQAEALQSHFYKMNYDLPTWLDNYLLAIRKGRFSALIAAMRSGVLKQGIIRNIIYLGLIMKGSYTKYLH